MIWNPQVINGVLSQDGSLAGNWYDVSQTKQGVIAPNTTNNVTVLLVGNYSTTSNSPINWTEDASLTAMNLSAGYNAAQTLVDATLTVNNDIQEDGNGRTLINISVPDTSSSLVLAGGSQTWYNWAFTGDGIVHLSGGAVTVGGNYNMSISDELKLDGGAMVYNSVANSNPINLVNGGYILVSSGGELDLNDKGFATTFITGDGKGGESLSIGYSAVGNFSGSVYFCGSGGAADRIEVPVWNAGDFTAKGDGGILTVTGTDPTLPNPNVSWYSSGENNGYTSLQGITLVAASGYDQEGNSTLLDAHGSNSAGAATLQAGDGSGTVTIGSGSKVAFLYSGDTRPHGVISINAATINFNGELDVHVNGAKNNFCDQIVLLNGNTTVNWGTGNVIQLATINNAANGWGRGGSSWEVVIPLLPTKDVTEAGARPIPQASPYSPLPPNKLWGGYTLLVDDNALKNGVVQVLFRRYGV